MASATPKRTGKRKREQRLNETDPPSNNQKVNDEAAVDPRFTAFSTALMRAAGEVGVDAHRSDSDSEDEAALQETRLESKSVQLPSSPSLDAGDAVESMSEDGDGESERDHSSGDDRKGSVIPSGDEKNTIEDELPRRPRKRLKVVEPMTQEELKAYQKAYQKRGVIYIARVPPRMRPKGIRSYFSQFGEVCRLFLTPEDKSAAKRRRRGGGARGKRFVDGWVEFAKKKVARRVAEGLNGTQVGGKKRNFNYYDLWMIKYLKGVTWDDLTDRIAGERAVKQQKIREEMSLAKKEARFYLDKVQQAKAITAMRDRRKRKHPEGDAKQDGKTKPIRQFFQRSAVTTGDGADTHVLKQVL